VTELNSGPSKRAHAVLHRRTGCAQPGSAGLDVRVEVGEDATAFSVARCSAVRVSIFVAAWRMSISPVLVAFERPRLRSTRRTSEDTNGEKGGVWLPMPRRAHERGVRITAVARGTCGAGPSASREVANSHPIGRYEDCLGQMNDAGTYQCGPKTSDAARCQVVLCRTMVTACMAAALIQYHWSTCANDVTWSERVLP